MKVYFTGSDVQLLNEFPRQLSRRKIFYVWLYRLFIRISKFCTEEYWVVHDHLVPELNRFGIYNVITYQHPVNHTRKYCKFPHKGFNILYYCPTGKDEKWNKWIYGYDIYQQAKKHYEHDRDVNFIRSWGQLDMSITYPITDFYLRCNRHDGGGRMVDECQIQGIPHYWSWEKPDINDIIKAIEDARRRKDNNR